MYGNLQELALPSSGNRRLCVRGYEYVLDRDSVLIFSVLAGCDVFLVDFELSAVSCENNQLVSSSKFKLVCQVVNAKKPKKSRVTHLQLKGVIVLLLT